MVLLRPWKTPWRGMSTSYEMSATSFSYHREPQRSEEQGKAATKIGTKASDCGSIPTRRTYKSAAFSPLAEGICERRQAKMLHITILMRS
jgi:hypothetical protein